MQRYFANILAECRYEAASIFDPYAHGIRVAAVNLDVQEVIILNESK